MPLTLGDWKYLNLTMGDLKALELTIGDLQTMNTEDLVRRACQKIQRFSIIPEYEVEERLQKLELQYKALQQQNSQQRKLSLSEIITICIGIIGLVLEYTSNKSDPNIEYVRQESICIQQAYLNESAKQTEALESIAAQVQELLVYAAEASYGDIHADSVECEQNLVDLPKQEPDSIGDNEKPNLDNQNVDSCGVITEPSNEPLDIIMHEAQDATPPKVEKIH